MAIITVTMETTIATATMTTTLTTVIATMTTAMATTTATATMPMLTPTRSREAMAIAGGERRRAYDMTTTLATIRNRIEDKRRDEDKRTLTQRISAANGP